MKVMIRSLTFDAKLGVSSKLENNQHQEETGECYSGDAHHHVHLHNENAELQSTYTEETSPGKHTLTATQSRMSQAVFISLSKKGRFSEVPLYLRGSLCWAPSIPSNIKTLDLAFYSVS